MQKLIRRLAAALLALLLLPAAQGQQQPPVRRPPLPPTLQRPSPTPPVQRFQRPQTQDRDEEEEERKAPAGRQTPEARTQDRRASFNADQGKIKLDFDGVDIADVIRTVSDVTGKNFILPDNVRGKVTILSPTAVSPDEVYAAFLAALEANNLAVYPVGKFLKVVPKKDAQRSSIPTIAPDGFYPWNEQMVTKLFRMEHVDVDAVTNIVKTLVSRDGEVQSVPPELLIVTDVGLNLHRIEKIVGQIDQAGGADEIRILQVRYASAADIADKLMQIFESEGGRTATPQRTTRRGRRTTPTPTAQDTGGELEVQISRVIADERTNKLVVIADEKSFRRIEEILAQLDVPTEGEGQVHVHYLDNANAEELAQTLSQLAQDQPGSTPARAGRPTPARAAARNGAADAGAVTSASLFEGEVKITADKATNSLVIISSYNDYKSLARVIERLDIPRRMVFVEAVIMEVGLNTTTEFGLAFHHGAAPDVNGDVAPAIVGTQLGSLNSLSLGNLLGLGGLLAGIQGPAVEGVDGIALPSFGVVLQALQRDDRVNVLSTPHITTADNEEAEIKVGQNVPFQAGFQPSGLSQALSGATGADSNLAGSALGSAYGLGGLGSLYAPIQRQNVELSLKIKPQVNESDYVRLVVEEQTEEIVATDPQLGPTTAKRSAKTTVVTRDGRTVVIGGLIQERKVDNVNKVPVLGDIPILGHLFRSNRVETRKTNLLLFLTPHIIRSDADYARILQKKMEERREYVELFYGMSGYDGVIDFERKVGPLGAIHRSLEDARVAPENGGPGRDVRVFTPETAPVSRDPDPEPEAVPPAEPSSEDASAPDAASEESPE